MSFFRNLARHKYKFALFGLLVLASLTSVLLALARMAYSDTHEHATLIKNLALAWIPFWFALFTYIISWSRKLLFLVVPASALVWLLFFPNAPYILIWFAWTGLLLGVVSLYLMHEIVARNFGRVVGWVFAMGVAALGSLGIYLGRFLRWNSWDVLQDPLPLARDLWHIVRYPFSSPRIYGFTLLYTLLFLFVYLAFHFFGRMVEERANIENKKQKT